MLIGNQENFIIAKIELRTSQPIVTKLFPPSNHYVTYVINSSQKSQGIKKEQKSATQKINKILEGKEVECCERGEKNRQKQNSDFHCWW